MNFQEFQAQCLTTAVYPEQSRNFVYPTLGLVGEAGEVAEKIKKAIRDDGGQITAERRQLLRDELGDVLYYLAQLATELELSLDDIAVRNKEKLMSRQRRAKLHGNGDGR